MSIKIYKSKKSMTGGGLVVLAIVFFGLTLPLIVAGLPVPSEKIFGLSVFWLLGIALTILPLGFKLEVSDDFVRTSFFGIRLRELHPSNIQVLEYGNLFRFGGLGVGKGLKGWETTANGGNKYFSIGESAYGKDAIIHAKRVLERKQH